MNASLRNPFRSGFGSNPDAAWIDTTSRLECVKKFTLQDCLDAIAFDDASGGRYLQKTVRVAVERKIRKLEKLQ